MNKKFLGISALLALILSSCGGTPSVDPSGSSVEPTTSETSSEGGSDSGTSTTSEETPVALNDVLDKLESLGHVYEGKITIGNEVLVLKQNANFTYLSGVGGVAKIVPVAPEQGGEEGGEEGGEQGGDQGGQEGLEQGRVSLDEAKFDEPARLLRRALAEPEVEEAEPVKFFAFYEGKDEQDKKAFEAQWGAVYDSEEEFLANNTAGGLGALIKSVVAQMDPAAVADLFAYSKSGKFYQVKNAAYVSAFAELVGLNLSGLTFAKANLSFEGNQFTIGLYQTAAEAKPSVNIVLEAKAEVKDEDLEAWLGSFEDYPHSPVAFKDLLGTFSSNNFSSVSDPYELLEGEYSISYKATEEAFNIEFTGKDWKEDYGYQNGMLNVGEGMEIVGGLYQYGVTKDNELSVDLIGSEDKDNYIENTGHDDYAWYEYAYCPQATLEFPAVYNGADEAMGAFHLGAAASATASKCFRGVYYGANLFTWTLKTGEKAVMNVTDTYISYKLGEDGKVSEIEVEAVCDLVDQTTGEVYYKNYGSVYETFSNFNNVAEAGKAGKFLNGLEEVTFAEDAPEVITLDATKEGEKTFDFAAAIDYAPKRLVAEYNTLESYFEEEDTVASISEEGILTAIAPGYTMAIADVGGATWTSDVQVKGLLPLVDDAYINELQVIPGGDATEFGVEVIALDEESIFAASSDNEHIAVVETKPELEEGEEAPTDEKFFKVTADDVGEGDITITATEPDGDVYTTKLHIVAIPSVNFAADDAFLAGDGSIEVDIKAPEEAVVEVVSDNEEVATVAFNAETKKIDVTKVAFGSFNLTINVTVGEEVYSDSVKVSLSESDVVGSFTLGAALGGAQLIIHADGTLRVIDGETVTEGTWQSVVQQGQEFGLITCDAKLGTIKASLYYITNNYDAVYCRVAYKYDVTDETTGETSTKTGATSARNVNIPLYSLRGDYYLNDGTHEYDVYIFNDGSYVFLLDNASVGGGEDFLTDYQAGQGEVILYVAMAEDQLSAVQYSVYYTQSKRWVISITTLVRASVDDEFAEDEEAWKGYYLTKYNFY